MIYLIHYDRSVGTLVSVTAYEDAQREEASTAKLDLEISLLGTSSVMEVVLLEAASEEHLRKTHRRYFETLSGLKAQEKR